MNVSYARALGGSRNWSTLSFARSLAEKELSDAREQYKESEQELARLKRTRPLLNKRQVIQAALMAVVAMVALGVIMVIVLLVAGTPSVLTNSEILLVMLAGVLVCFVAIMILTYLINRADLANQIEKAQTRQMQLGNQIFSLSATILELDGMIATSTAQKASD